MPTWQAIVFDLDDTLYPEQDYVFSGFRAVARWVEKKMGIPFEIGFGELKSLFEQGIRGNTFNLWLGKRELATNDMILELVRIYRDHAPVLTPFPDTLPLLGALAGHYSIGLVSDGYLDVQRRKFSALDLVDYFNAVVYSDEFGRMAWKPSTKPFEAVLQLLSADAQQTMYVADNPLKDFIGARQVGIFTIRIQRAGGEYSHIGPPTYQHAPDLTITSLLELQDILAIQGTRN